MKHEPVWKSKTEEVSYPPLSGDTTVDIAVIGGGITGITTAYLLAAEGKKVAVLESHKIGEGTTGNSTGNLYALVDERLHKIDTRFGSDKMVRVKQSRREAVDFIESMVTKYSISCDFIRAPWFLFSETEKKKKDIEKETDAAHEAGLQVSSINGEVSFPIAAGLKVDAQAQFNPLQYVKQLAKNINNANCAIYEHTSVRDFQEGEPCIVKTDGGTVTCRKIVMATHMPKGFMLIQTLLGPYREYGLAFKLSDENYPSPGIYWAMEDQEHHSYRTYDNGTEKFLVVVGEHHKVGQKKDYNEGYMRLEKWARQRFNLNSISYRWSAQHYRPADGLPYIGHNGDNMYIATGYSTDGLTYGTVAAKIISDDIFRHHNSYADLYVPSRFNPQNSAGKLVKENVNAAGQYYRNIPGIADASHFSDIKPGEGKTIEAKGQKLAAYRDESGTLIVINAVCPHLGCIVDFNNAEHTWDCPCHGSRFTLDGEVIEGPAMNRLERVQVGA